MKQIPGPKLARLKVVQGKIIHAETLLVSAREEMATALIMLGVDSENEAVDLQSGTVTMTSMAKAE